MGRKTGKGDTARGFFCPKKGSKEAGNRMVEKIVEK